VFVRKCGYNAVLLPILNLNFSKAVRRISRRGMPRRKENTVQHFEIAGLAEGKRPLAISMPAITPLDLHGSRDWLFRCAGVAHTTKLGRIVAYGDRRD
jgi:hypothetical protein